MKIKNWCDDEAIIINMIQRGRINSTFFLTFCPITHGDVPACTYKLKVINYAENRDT